MLLLMILPPSVARDLGTTVMMLPLVVLTYVAPPGEVDTLPPIVGLPVGREYVAWVPATNNSGAAHEVTKSKETSCWRTPGAQLKGLHNM